MLSNCYSNEFARSGTQMLVLLQSNRPLVDEILAALDRVNTQNFKLTPEQLLKATSITGKPPLATLRDLMRAARAESSSELNAQDQLPASWRVRAQLTRAAGGKIELLDGQGVSKGAAFVQPSAANGGVARLTGISIAAGQQAQGLGSALHRQLERELRALGFIAIEASPLPGTERFYQRLGYVQDASRPTSPWVKPLGSAAAATAPDQSQPVTADGDAQPIRRAYRFEPNERGGYRVVETTPDKAQFFEENGVRYMHPQGREEARIDRATGTVSSATGQTPARSPVQANRPANADASAQPNPVQNPTPRPGKLSSNNIFLGKIQPLSQPWARNFTRRLEVSAFDLTRGVGRDAAAQQVLESYRQRVIADLREVLTLYRGNIEVVFQGTAQKLDLSGADLSGLDLRNVRFQGVTNSGQLVLREINLERANLSGSDLRDVDLRNANLRGANLQGALLDGAQMKRVRY
jgi:GNAT superfamily N-acetyltransferase